MKYEVQLCQIHEHILCLMVTTTAQFEIREIAFPTYKRKCAITWRLRTLTSNFTHTDVFIRTQGFQIYKYFGHSTSFWPCNKGHKDGGAISQIARYQKCRKWRSVYKSLCSNITLRSKIWTISWYRQTDGHVKLQTTASQSPQSSILWNISAHKRPCLTAPLHTGWCHSHHQTSCTYVGLLDVFPVHRLPRILLCRKFHSSPK